MIVKIEVEESGEEDNVLEAVAPYQEDEPDGEQEEEPDGEQEEEAPPSKKARR